jgi:hypothetical protein
MKLRFLLFLLMCLHLRVGAQHFSNEARDQGVRILHDAGSHESLVSTGACWFDCDGDGDLDLFVMNEGANHLFRNNRIGTGTADFTDIANGDLLNADNGGSAVAAADYDNDGDNDLYIANYLDDVLLQNDGNGNFTDVTSTAFPGISPFVSSYGTTVAWGDLNNDGWLDLYVGNYTFDQDIYEFSNDFLFISNGGDPVTFSDRSDLLAGDVDGDGIDDLKGYSWAAIMTDFDNDGLLDIYATNDCPHSREDSKLWRNLGDLEFSEVSIDIGPDTRGKIIFGERLGDCFNAMGITRGDVNRDGYLDYHMSNIHNVNENTVLFMNRGGTFVNASYSAGLDDNIFKPEIGLLFTWGTLFFDYDLDRRLDLITAGGSFFSPLDMPNFLYHNESGEVGEIPILTEVDREVSGVSSDLLSRTVIIGDYDMDNDPDLYMTNFKGITALYRNNIDNGNNSVAINLKGAGPPLSNLNGIGAKIYLTTADQLRQLHEVHSGSGLGGGDDMAAYFGLAEYTLANTEIVWPSGIRQSLSDVSANQRITIDEPKLGISFPKGNEKLQLGSTHMITWKSVFSEQAVDIKLVKEGHDDIILAEDEPNDGTYEWLISESIDEGDGYSIRIENSEDAEMYGITNTSFTLIDADTYVVDVTWPNGGQLINQNEEVSITWTGLDAESVSIRLLSGMEEVLSITESAENSGTFEWQVPDMFLGNNYRIEIEPSEGFKDVSDNPFVITSYTPPAPVPDPLSEEPNTDPETDPLVTKVDFVKEEFDGFINYPNPFSDFTHLRYKLDSEGSTRIKVYDVMGNLLVDQKLGHQKAGVYEWKVNTEKFVPGILFAQLSLGNQPLRTIKMIKQ